jgi:YebC/PmpR family DNA-binding regulatory protein
MWRGPTVAAQKEKGAKAKSKIYGMHSKLISLTSEKWSDPTLNPSLYDAIASAKKDGVTSDVIDRAVKRGAGLDKDSAKIEEIYYEGYAPGGVAIIVRALTDNRNRTAPSMRHIFSAFGGSLGETGSVSNFAFDYVWLITIAKPEDMDALEMAIMETDAEDYSEEDGMIVIRTGKQFFAAVQSSLQTAGYTIETSSLGYSAKVYAEVTDFDNALKIYKMLEEFDADEDVETVWNTADISDALWAEVETFVAARRFRT